MSQTVAKAGDAKGNSSPQANCMNEVTSLYLFKYQNKSNTFPHKAKVAGVSAFMHFVE